MKVKQSLFLKIVAFLLAVVCFGAAAAMTAYQVFNFEEIWGDSSPFYGYELYSSYWDTRDDIQEMLDLYGEEDLSAYYQKKLEQIEESLSAENTNLRWQVHSEENKILYGNIQADLPDTGDLFSTTVRLDPNIRGVTYTELCWEECSYSEGTKVVYCEDWRVSFAEALEAYLNGDTSIDPDAVYVDRERGTTEVLLVATIHGEVGYAPTLRSTWETNEYGYVYDLNLGWTAQKGESVYGELILWLAEDLPVQDDLRAAYLRLTTWREERGLILGGTVLLALAGILLTVFLCVCSGHRRGQEGISLCWFHYIPGDLLLAAEIGIGVLCVVLMDSIYWWNYDGGFRVMLGAVALCAAVLATLIIGFLVTFVARCKGRVVLRYTVIGWLCGWICRICRVAVNAIPLIWKVAVLGAGYLILTLVLFYNSSKSYDFWAGGSWLLVWVVMTLVVIAYLCWWAFQWKRLRLGAREIISGNTDHHIDSGKMPPDLKAHANQLNNLGQAIGAAVEDRMRSEHFKTELITNVSHDLKTPLTSIINYVDLLKKEELDNPRALEYIEVLDRKSQRLKKLTEDLVEASKASTGALNVNRERLDLLQLADQALGEYEQRLREHGLSVVRTMPGEPVWVVADGRHLWRIMDNLLSNCAKYALPGTRIYVEVQPFSDCVRLAVKNISREELNVPEQELMERFVRGDQSRTEEGSGLGLSIARSLAELQGGTFDILVDGDLFKAIVTLPRADEQ